MKKIGILGGTFDPPHIGHLIIADEVKSALQLDKIWFIPTNEPPHKKKAASSNEHRLTMLKSMLSTTADFVTNPIEMDRSGKSYTIETIKTLKKQHPDTSFYFIIGGDMVEYLPKWKQIDELFELVQFVGVKRPNYSIETNYPIIEVTVPQLDISSTNIKERVKQQKPFRFFVHDLVYQYIKKERLYE